MHHVVLRAVESNRLNERFPKTAGIPVFFIPALFLEIIMHIASQVRPTTVMSAS